MRHHAVLFVDCILIVLGVGGFEGLGFGLFVCISACILVSKSIVDRLIDKHREQVFPKMKAQSP